MESTNNHKNNSTTTIPLDQQLEEQLEQLILNDNISQDNSNNSHDNLSNGGAKEMNQIIRQTKIQLLLKREPSNVIIVENIDQQTSSSVESIIQEFLEQSCLSPLILVRHISILNSLILVFVHKNDSHHCKLLLERLMSQSIIQSFTIYFGKELSQSIIQRYQLTPPFATRQFLISPPLSPPNEWEAPGDGLESGPDEDIESHPSSFSGFDPQQLNNRLQLVYQDQTNNNFPSITVEFCT